MFDHCCYELTECGKDFSLVFKLFVVLFTTCLAKSTCQGFKANWVSQAPDFFPASIQFVYIPLDLFNIEKRTPVYKQQSTKQRDIKLRADQAGRACRPSRRKD